MKTLSSIEISTLRENHLKTMKRCIIFKGIKELIKCSRHDPSKSTAYRGFEIVASPDISTYKHIVQV